MTRQEGPEGPFAVQIEWLNHRYDPGHFLGGTLRPELRLSLGGNAKRVAAALFGASGLGLLGALGILSVGASFPLADPLSIATACLNLLVARRLWASADADGPAAILDVAAQGRRLGRILAVVAIATAVFVSLAVCTLAAAAFLSVLMRDHPGITAAAVVLSTTALVRARGQRVGE